MSTPTEERKTDSQPEPINEVENQETTTQVAGKQKALWAAGISTFIGLSFFILLVYIIIVEKDGVFALSDSVLMPVTMLMFLASLTGYLLIRRDRITLGTGIVFAISIIPPIIAVFILTGLAFVSILFIISLSLILIFGVMPKTSRRWAMIATVVSIIIITIIDIWDPAYRLPSSASTSNFVYILIPLIGVGLLVAFFLLRENISAFWRSSVRNRLTAIVILASVIPALLVSITLGVAIYKQVRSALLNNTFDKLGANEIELSTFRKKLSVVLQDIYLFAGSIRENVLMGRENIEDADLLQALECSGVNDFLPRIPGGLDAVLTDRGKSLSAGQRQAIALARALVNNPEVLLMDEPTAALDLNSEQSFVRRLQPLLDGKTLITVTHRLPLLELVDRIIVLADGKIALDGPKDKVLQQLQGAK